MVIIIEGEAHQPWQLGMTEDSAKAMFNEINNGFDNYIGCVINKITLLNIDTLMKSIVMKYTKAITANVVFDENNTKKGKVSIEFKLVRKKS